MMKKSIDECVLEWVYEWPCRL